MRKSPNVALIVPFLATWLATLIIPGWFPWCRLTFFAPFLVLACYRLPLHHLLWWALACGTTLDLIASSHRLGILAATFCLSAFLIFRLKKHFFEDNFSTIPIMTAIFSLTSTLIHAVLTKVFDQSIRFSFGWVITDMILLPAFDVAYATLFFALPRMSKTKGASLRLPADRPQ